MRAAGPTGPSHHVVRARSFDSGDGGAGKFCEPVRRTLNGRKHHIKVPRAGVGCVSTRLTVKARIWPAGQYGSDRRFLPEAIQAAGGVWHVIQAWLHSLAPPSYLLKAVPIGDHCSLKKEVRDRYRLGHRAVGLCCGCLVQSATWSA